MKNLLFAAAIMVAGSALVFASVDGTVLNRTTGRPVAGVEVNMLQPGAQGMQMLDKTQTDASGRFVFQRDRPAGPMLLQVSYKDVHYDKLLTPNIPASNVGLEIYEPTKSPGAARVVQRMLVFEANSSRIGVDETVIIQNDSNTTYKNDELGALRFYLPPAANGQMRVSAQPPNGMPLPQAPEKTAESDVFQVNFPIKPGESQIEVNYVLPVGSPFKYRGRVVGVKGMPAGPLRLIAPPGVTLAGSDIQKLGVEPSTQATIFNVVGNGNFSVDIAGTGSLHQEDSSSEDSDAPQITEGKPPIYAHRNLLIALALAILAIGVVMLYRTSPVRAPQNK
jgi:hypothetical protein